MKISKSILSKICIAAGFLVLAQLSFAGEVIIHKDGDPDPTPVMHAPFFIPVTAFIDDNGLALDFIVPEGVATITVYDESHNVVHQEVLDTNTNLSTLIPSDEWNGGSYTVTIHYGTTNLIGNFEL
jgi:hypothetical protein